MNLAELCECAHTLGRHYGAAGERGCVECRGVCSGFAGTGVTAEIVAVPDGD